jgi:hypothetical protein
MVPSFNAAVALGKVGTGTSSVYDQAPLITAEVAVDRCSIFGTLVVAGGSSTKTVAGRLAVAAGAVDRLVEVEGVADRLSGAAGATGRLV